jgi:hypothetical protein
MIGLLATIEKIKNITGKDALEKPDKELLQLYGIRLMAELIYLSGEMAQTDGKVAEIWGNMFSSGRIGEMVNQAISSKLPKTTVAECDRQIQATPDGILQKQYEYIRSNVYSLCKLIEVYTK